MQFGKGRAKHQRDPAVFSQDFYVPCGKALLVPNKCPLDCRKVQFKARLQNSLLSPGGSQRKMPFPLGLPSWEGWALEVGKAPCLFAVTYQGNRCCCCSSSFSRLLSAADLKTWGLVWGFTVFKNRMQVFWDEKAQSVSEMLW